MDWLSRSLQLFKKKKIIEIVPIPLSQLKLWIQKQSREIIAQSNLHYVVTEYKQKLAERRWMLECYLDQWHDKNTQEEIDIFLSKTRQLLEKITFSEGDIDAIISTNSLLKEKVEKLIEEVEQSPFAHHFRELIEVQQAESSLAINPLLKELMELNGIMADLEQHASRRGLKTIKSLIRKEQKLQQSTIKLTALRLKVQRQREKWKLAEKLKQEKEAELSLLQQNPNYETATATQQQKKTLHHKIADRKKVVTTIFQQLQPLLEQYQQLHPDNATAAAYMDDANTAIINDEGLQINHILKHCHAAVEKHKFVLPDGQRNIIFKTLEKADVHFWTKMQQQFLYLQRELQQIELESEEKNFIAKIDDVLYRQQHFSTLAEELQERITVLETEIEEIEEKQFADKSLFENMIRMTFGKGMEIII